MNKRNVGMAVFESPFVGGVVYILYFVTTETQLWVALSALVLWLFIMIGVWLVCN